MGTETNKPFTWPPNPVADEPPATTVQPVATMSPPTPADDNRGFWARLEAALLGGGGGARLLDDWEPDPVDFTCPRCGGPVGFAEADEQGCTACRDTRLAWRSAVTLGQYRGPLRDAITACKYRNDRRAGRAVGTLLARRAADRFHEDRVDPAGVLLIPVPTTTRRRLENTGLDHTLLLASEVGRALGVRPRRLLERRHTPHQAGLSAAARARNVAGTIRVRHALPVPRPADVVLVDDVRTTGATASACFRAITDRFGVEWAGGEGRPSEAPCFWLVTAAVSSHRRGRPGRSSAGGGLHP
ncbi:MAG: ComF family protein [Phycisphaeraceae bacterium]|nr:MAG: ComF family protein [Phycisphaeraceae bacterium]